MLRRAARRACCWRWLPLAAAADDELRSGCRTSRRRISRLIYFDPLGYLTPHAVRTFTNSLAWQRRIFGWKPSRADDVLLKDFSDYGNASPVVAPRNRLFFDIAPLSHAFETYPASERMFSLMNHELVHVATGDVAADEDRVVAPLLLRQGRAAAGAPGVAALQLSRRCRASTCRAGISKAAPCSWKRGWPAASAARRAATTRWCSARWCATTRTSTIRSALESRGVARRLPGRRERLPLRHALLHLARVRLLAGEGHRVAAARRRQRALLRRPVPARLRHAARTRPGSDWIAWEHEFQRAQPRARCASYPITPHRRLAATAVGSISRMPSRRGDRQCSTARSAIPGVVAHVGALDPATATIRRLADIKGAMLYRVTSLAYDPASSTAFYTTDNHALRDLMAVDVATGEARMLLATRASATSSFNPADRSLWGVRHLNGFVTLVRIPHPYTSGTRSTRSRSASCRSISTSPPTARLLSASVGEVNGDQSLRVWEHRQGARRATLKPLSRVPASASRCRRASCSRRTAATSTAAATTPASRTSSATRSRPARSRRCRTPRPASSARSRSPTAR